MSQAILITGQSAAPTGSTSSSLPMTYQQVETEAVEVNGIRFHYRRLGTRHQGIPVIYLNHLSATLDNCDPRIMDGIATQHQIISFDNLGVGATKGRIQKTIPEMAKDARAFIHALGYERVVLFGFSLGGMIAQEILEQEPSLVHKLILAGTGPRGGRGISDVIGVTVWDILKGYLTFRDPKFYLFFTSSRDGRAAARAFLNRLGERTENRDEEIQLRSLGIQLQAIKAWGSAAPADLSVYRLPVLIVNGDQDRMVPTVNSYDLAKRFQNSEVIIYPDAGHGGIFQNYEAFVKSALSFLASKE